MSPQANVLESTDFLGVADPARLFVIGGMLLVIAGMIFGDIYAIFILHPNVADIGREMSAAVTAAAVGDAESVFTHFGAVGSFLENAGTKKDTHVHIIHAGYLAFLLAFLQPWVALERQTKVRLAKVFLWASVILPTSIFTIHYVGLLYSPLQSIGWASIFADLSGLVLILVLAVELAGIWRYMRGNGDRHGAVRSLDGKNSRTLLAGGVILVLVGFLLGLYYAAVHLEEHELRELIILGDLLKQVSMQATEAINHGLVAYGGLQEERAIMIATHAHIVEMGFLALMMAIVQPFVFLSPGWRRRLVWMMLGGAALLPIAIYSERWFGLLAGGVADFAGLLVILAMFGMLFGVLRHTGKMDAEEEELV
jgi:hypothetical protein